MKQEPPTLEEGGGPPRAAASARPFTLSGAVAGGRAFFSCSRTLPLPLPLLSLLLLLLPPCTAQPCWCYDAVGCRVCTCRHAGSIDAILHEKDLMERIWRRNVCAPAGVALCLWLRPLKTGTPVLVEKMRAAAAAAPRPHLNLTTGQPADSNGIK